MDKFAWTGTFGATRRITSSTNAESQPRDTRPERNDIMSGNDDRTADKNQNAPQETDQNLDQNTMDQNTH